MLKTKDEMEKLKKINQGATEYLKQQKKDLVKGKLNKNIQEFTINDPAAQTAAQTLKNKSKVPVDVDLLHDAEGLQDEMKKLTEQLRVLVEDSKQVSKNICYGEREHRKAKEAFDAVLNEKKLILKGGTLEP